MPPSEEEAEEEAEDVGGGGKGGGGTDATVDDLLMGIGLGGGGGGGGLLGSGSSLPRLPFDDTSPPRSPMVLLGLPFPETRSSESACGWRCARPWTGPAIGTCPSLPGQTCC